MGLAEYNRKRNFGVTREPPGDAPAQPRADGARVFVIQKHAATRLHYDFRLELDGVLLSWSVPKGPSLDPTVKRLAMHVEDHPLAYGGFEGIIPKGQYGGGTVLLWDRGTWEPQEDPVAGYAKGNLKFILKGEKLQGGFALIRLGGRRAKEEGNVERAWLLIKEKDGQVRKGAPELTETRPESVATGRTLEAIAADKTSVWHSKPSHVDLAGAPGARAAPLPARPRPPRAVSRSKPPEGADWLHEIAIDGVRVLARNERSKIQLFSDQGTALPPRAASKDKPIGEAVRMLPAETLMVDGVVAPLTADGEKLGYFLFDLPYLDGHDLSRVPLERRKALLEELVRRADQGSIRYVEHIAGGGADFHREACRLGIGTMVSRRADSRYDAKAGWVTVACKKDKKKDKKKASAPLPDPLPASRGERTGPRGEGTGQPLPKDFRLTTPERVLWPDVGKGFTKLELVRYYQAVADFILPEIVGRPLSLFRCPNGMPADPKAKPACFFMKHPGLMTPRSLEKHRILERSKPDDYMVARDLAGVLELVQMSILEIHPWNASVDEIEFPDRVIFDLDPDPAVPWSRVVEAAFELRRRLAALDLDSVVKTTGGKGLHVVMPFSSASRVSWDDAFAFSQTLSERLAADQPAGYVATMSKAKRTGKIFIDYFRNHRGSTAIAAYSTRARAGATVAVPLAWDELTPALDPRGFTVETVPARVAGLKVDPWAATMAAKQRLTAKALRGAR